MIWKSKKKEKTFSTFIYQSTASSFLWSSRVLSRVLTVKMSKEKGNVLLHILGTGNPLFFLSKFLSVVVVRLTLSFLSPHTHTPTKKNASKEVGRLYKKIIQTLPKLYLYEDEDGSRRKKGGKKEALDCNKIC